MSEDAAIITKSRATIVGGNGGYHTIQIDGKTVKIKLTANGLEISNFRKSDPHTQFRNFSFDDIFDASIGQRALF